MCIALGGIYQESHSFSPAPATLDQFRAGYLLYGEDIVRELQDINHEVGGALTAAEGHDIVPLAYASAGSSGQPLRRAAYAPLAAEILVLSAPGVCSPDLRAFPWKRISRPMFPFDDIEDETWLQRPTVIT